MTNCTSPDKNDFFHWKYTNRDIKIEKVYKSSKSWFLAKLILTGYKCDGLYGYDHQWFILKNQQHAQFLEKSMSFLESADVDGDGSAELIFSIDKYNTGGYRIYYDNLNKHKVMNLIIIKFKIIINSVKHLSFEK